MPLRLKNRDKKGPKKQRVVVTTFGKTYLTT